MPGLFSRVKNWTDSEVLTNEDLNAEFDNILNNFVPASINDYSTNITQMQSTVDPYPSSTESLATTLAGEIDRIRYQIKAILGESQWYYDPDASLSDLNNNLLELNSALLRPANRIESGRKRAGSSQPIFLVPAGSTNTVTLKGASTPFVYYVDGTQYTISTDVALTGLTTAPASNNTALTSNIYQPYVAGTGAADIYDLRKLLGEGTVGIPLSSVGSEISALDGKIEAFKFTNSTDEYFVGRIENYTDAGNNTYYTITDCFRGFFFNSSDNPVPRLSLGSGVTITLLKLSWVFAKTDGTLSVTYNYPFYQSDTPTSPSIGDYWFDTANETWKTYNGSSWSSAGATLVGYCCQDTSNTVGARSIEFFKYWDNTNGFSNGSSEISELSDGASSFRSLSYWDKYWHRSIRKYSNTVAYSVAKNPAISVNGNYLYFPGKPLSWDITLDLDSGITEAASTIYYFYITEDGDRVLSDVAPYVRHDMLGLYHPHQTWRCIGSLLNDLSSNFNYYELTQPVVKDQSMSMLLLYGGNGHGSTSTAVRRFSNYIQGGTAFAYVDSSTNGARVLIMEDGIYSISYTEFNNAADFGFGIVKVNLTSTLTSNPCILTSPISESPIVCSSQKTNTIGNVSVVHPLARGTVIAFATDGATGNTDNNTTARITKIRNIT